MKILFLSSNPWTTSRILVDEEAREVFEKLQEGPYRDLFELHTHTAIRAVDLQRLLMTYEPDIVHFSGHGSKQKKLILAGAPGRGKQVEDDDMVQLLGLYKSHVRLVVLNACFTRPLAKSLSEVIDYSIGAGKGIGDKEGVAFASAFYRALSFGKSIKAAFGSAHAELAVNRMPRIKGVELFIRNGVPPHDSFPQADVEACAQVNYPVKRASVPSRHPAQLELIEKKVVLLPAPGKRIAEFRIPLLATSTADSGEPISKAACPDCTLATLQVSSMFMENTLAARNVTRQGDKPARRKSTRFPQDTSGKSLQVDRIRQEIRSRGCTSESRSYVAVTINLHEVVNGDSNDLVQRKRLEKTRRIARVSTPRTKRGRVAR